MSVKRVSQSEIKKSVSAGRTQDVPPSGIPPVLRASWKFARDTAGRFNQQLLKDRVDDFLKKLAKRFV